ncbi:mandelate racemase/muconate lactonizing enzyme family protein [Thalassoglobus polymorphus]|uniref:O-succinylbenzoate synthase n=1 Tax=Thalassoglobus polymorphus TaxID=2527994 RepID=A0A517QII4_9PLAN|nr:mandelate racemase/muconate lactonizing enzyme family protein [Thalassoglobus polymorphus]QDT31446.1 o-succinylbenzoate synthase [Thalassoglobus polymorphus]
MLASRRRFLAQSAATSVLAFSSLSRSNLLAQGSAVSEHHYEVVDVKQTTVKLEYRPAPRRNMDRELPHWRYTEFCEVQLKSQVTGTGETLLYYNWGVPSELDVKRVIGRSAIEMMWDDTLGSGLQMALFDAVGKTAGVPVHALMGQKVHEKTPLSWWNIDTIAEDMASECQLAEQSGYRWYKTKGRPWFDVFAQMDAATKLVSESFKIDMDFNDTLRDADRAMPILERLAEYPQTDIFESPIPQTMVKDNQRITKKTDVKVAMHYGKPSPTTVVRSKCCDGFVIGGGATRVLSRGRFCEQTEMPFWLQLVGSGMTAAFSLHFGGALEQAVWPAVNCHQLYEDDLLVQPIKVEEGYARVPDAPGIGYELNRDLVEKLKVPKPKRRPEPQRLIETSWPDGRKIYTASNGKVNFMLDAANRERYPFFEDGADTRLVENDGSDQWKRLYESARKNGPIAG